jgi:hypothetical protein
MVALPSLGSEKKELAERYQQKYLLVLREGLVAGVCSHVSKPAILPVLISESGVQYKAIGYDRYLKNPHDPFTANYGQPGCGAMVPLALRKGEVLKVLQTQFYRNHFMIIVNTVSSRSVTRGEGKHQHQSQDIAGAAFRFDIQDKKDFLTIEPLADKWLRIFDAKDDAAKFSNQTATH